MVLLIDGDSTVWELIKRKDITLSDIDKEGFRIKSIVDCEENNMQDMHNRLLNIEIKDNNRSLATSEMDVSRDFNISIIKEL